MATYTVTEALAKLKLTNKKIENATSQVLIGYTVTGGNKTVPPGFRDQEEFKKEVKARLDSAAGLVAFRDKLKKAVVESNARTKVVVGKKEMTVAEAIETKASIKNRKALCLHLTNNLMMMKTRVATHNASLDGKADEHVSKTFGASAATVPEADRAACREAYLKNNTAYLVTHDSLESYTDQLRDEIEDFEMNVDVALSVVNARTEIHVPD